MINRFDLFTTPNPNRFRTQRRVWINIRNHPLRLRRIESFDLNDLIHNPRYNEMSLQFRIVIGVDILPKLTRQSQVPHLIFTDLLTENLCRSSFMVYYDLLE